MIVTYQIKGISIKTKKNLCSYFQTLLMNGSLFEMGISRIIMLFKKKNYMK